MDSSSNSRQAMWVAVGQFFAYAIGIVSPMILSRYFEKGDYGTYRQVMYVYSTLLVVFNFGLPRAYSYFIPRVSLGESKDVIKKITNIFIILGILLSAILFFCSRPISVLLNNNDLDFALKCFAPTPLFLLPIMGLDCILASYKKAHLIAFYSISTRVLALLCIIFPVIFFNGSYIHAIIGFDIASLIQFLLALYLRDIPTKGIDIEKTHVTFKEIFSFTLPLLTASVWIMIFDSSNQFFVSRYYGNEVFADFSNGFISFPIIPMVIGSVATVLMPVFSELAAHDISQIKQVWLNALVKTVKIIYPIIVYCILFAPLMMTCFYGSQYENSGIYFVLKNVEGFFLIIPFYPILLALGKSKAYSNIHLVIALIIVPLEYIVTLQKWPCVMICVVYVICSASKVVLQFIAVSKAVNLSYIELIPFKSMIRIAIVSFVSGLLPFTLFCMYPEVNKFAMLFFLSILYTIGYYCLCWAIGISYKEIIGGYIRDSRFNCLIRLIP